jgi:hypothetical protein
MCRDYICVLILFMCDAKLQASLLTYADVCWRMLTYAYWRVWRRRQCSLSLRCRSSRRICVSADYLLYMCPHTTMYASALSSNVLCVLKVLGTCPHTAIHVFSYYWMCPHTPICVHILLWMCPDTTIRVSSSSYTCVLILLCPHTPMCVHILLWMCPDTTIRVSSSSYTCVLILLCI